MKTVFIKYAKDRESFSFFKSIGANIIELNNPEEIDMQIKNLYNNNCKRIVITNELSNFSQDIIKKYKANENFSIIIAPKK